MQECKWVSFKSDYYICSCCNKVIYKDLVIYQHLCNGIIVAEIDNTTIEQEPKSNLTKEEKLEICYRCRGFKNNTCVMKCNCMTFEHLLNHSQCPIGKW